MTRRARRAADPLDREIEAAFDPGRFVPDWACFSFVTDLAEVEDEIARLIATSPARAIALYEAFLAGCYVKADELDDSSGSFGRFVSSLSCGWIRARQAAAAAPDQTATRLLAWMDDDPFGFCHQLEKDAAAVLDKAGLAALAIKSECASTRRASRPQLPMSRSLRRARGGDRPHRARLPRGRDPTRDAPQTRAGAVLGRAGDQTRDEHRACFIFPRRPSETRARPAYQVGA